MGKSHAPRAQSHPQNSTPNRPKPSQTTQRLLILIRGNRQIPGLAAGAVGHSLLYSRRQRILSTSGPICRYHRLSSAPYTQALYVARVTRGARAASYRKQEAAQTPRTIRAKIKIRFPRCGGGGVLFNGLWSRAKSKPQKTAKRKNQLNELMIFVSKLEPRG